MPAGLAAVLLAEMLVEWNAEISSGIPVRFLRGRAPRNDDPSAVPRGSQGLYACQPSTRERLRLLIKSLHLPNEQENNVPL